jgi:hypothetical protein
MTDHSTTPRHRWEMDRRTFVGGAAVLGGAAVAAPLWSTRGHL